jgi:hypothetical protein
MEWVFTPFAIQAIAKIYVRYRSIPKEAVFVWTFLWDVTQSLLICTELGSVVYFLLSESAFRRGRDSSVGSDSLRAGRSGDRIPVGAKFSAPIQTGRGAYPASYTVGAVSFPGVKRPGRDVGHLPPSSAEVNKRVSAIPLLPLWIFVACSRFNFKTAFWGRASVFFRCGNSVVLLEFKTKKIKGKRKYPSVHNFTLSVVTGSNMFRLYSSYYQAVKIENNEIGGHVARMGRGKAYIGFW